MFSRNSKQGKGTYLSNPPYIQDISLNASKNNTNCFLQFSEGCRFWEFMDSTAMWAHALSYWFCVSGEPKILTYLGHF